MDQIARTDEEITVLRLALAEGRLTEAHLRHAARHQHTLNCALCAEIERLAALLGQRKVENRRLTGAAG